MCSQTLRQWWDLGAVTCYHADQNLKKLLMQLENVLDFHSHHILANWTENVCCTD